MTRPDLPPMIKVSSTATAGRSTKFVALAAWLAGLGFLAIALLTPASGGPTDLFGTIVGVLALLLGILPTITVGLILVVRLPKNLIGWLLLVGGLLLAVGSGVSSLADYGLNVNPGSVPGAVWLAWLSQWISLPFTVLLLGYLPLLFPTGRLLSRLWRLATVAGVVALVFAVARNAFIPFPPGDYPTDVHNPLAVSGLDGDAVGTIGWVLLFAVVLLALASLVVRYRRGSGVEGEQIKWFAAVMAVAGPALVIGALTFNATSGIWAQVSTTAFAISGLGMALLPVAIGIAVLRYRLYEIDRLISRSIGWGVLTVILGAVFVGLVLGLQTVLAPFTGSNELAVAGSTLLVFSLFQPLRRRVQGLVDKRFNRSRYDAQRALDAYSARLRDEVDLDTLQGSLLTIVEATLEPTTASLWLRE
jgi:hypothetical protein